MGGSDYTEYEDGKFASDVFIKGGSSNPLAFKGTVTTATSPTVFASTGLTGHGNDAFVGWYVYVFHDAGGSGAAPQGEYQLISDYDSSTGTFTHAAFTADLVVGDEVFIICDEIIAGSENLKSIPATIDLNQAAATYPLFTGANQAVTLERLTFRMPNVDISGGALTSISIHTDDVTPAVIFDTLDGILANLTQEGSLGWSGSIPIRVGTILQLTIAGGAGGVACVCDIVAQYRPDAAGGILS